MSEPDSPGRLAAAARSLGRQISLFVERLVRRAADKRWTILAILSTVFLSLASWRASRRLFWNDELFTLVLARLESVADLIKALSDGVDFNSPILYLLVGLCDRVVPWEHVAARIPSIMALWVCCVATYCFVLKRANALAGAVSFLFILTTTAFWYATEARPHALVLGGAGVALLAWQRSGAPGVHGAAWRVLLALGLSGAALAHPYGVFVVLPLCVGEVFRFVSSRRFDWTLYGALCFGPIAGFASLPALRRVRVMADGFYAVSPQSLFDAYRFPFKPAVVVLAAIVASLAFCDMRRGKRRPETSGADDIPGHEFAALATFGAIPLVAWLAAAFTGAPFIPRYGLASVLCLALAIGIYCRNRPGVSVALACVLGGQILVDVVRFHKRRYEPEPVTEVRLSTDAAHFNERYREFAAYADRHSHVLLLDDLDFMPTLYYAPPGFPLKLTYATWDSGDVNGRAFRLLAPYWKDQGASCDLDGFLAAQRRFLAYGRLDRRSAGGLRKISELQAMGASVSLVSITDDSFIAEVVFESSGRPIKQ